MSNEMRNNGLQTIAGKLYYMLPDLSDPKEIRAALQSISLVESLLGQPAASAEETRSVPVSQPAPATTDTSAEASNTPPTIESVTEPSLSKAELRAKLAVMSAKIDLPAIMLSMGYENLSSVPTSQYDALLKKATDAYKQVGGK